MEPAPYSSFPEWNYLPNEIKTNVIRKMDNNSRLALRECSSDCQKLVDAVPYHQIHKLSVHYQENEWCIDISRSVNSDEITLKFPTFDEFQNHLSKEIRIYDYIQEMTISNEVINNNVNLLRFGELVRIGTLYLYGANSNLPVILDQVDQNHLKSLRLGSYYPVTLHIPQITCKDLWVIFNNNIRDDQLITIESSYVKFSHCEMLTASGINNYIQKCLSNLDKNHVSFLLCCSNRDIFSEVIEGLDIASSREEKKVWINSPFPNLKLEVGCSGGLVIGRTIGNGTLQNDVIKSKAQKNFKVIEFMQISTLGDRKWLIIGEKNKGQINYEFESRDDMQLKLTEELDKIDYIKNLTIYSSFDGWKLTTPTKNKITVGIFSISRGFNRIDYLRQIEPNHLKYISIELMDDAEEMYDMPQVIHAEKLIFSDSCIRDDQLLKLNAVYLKISTNNDGGICNLTDSGINAFVKKCLLELNQHDFNFCFSGAEQERDEAIFFEGLDIFSQKQISELKKETIVNSPYPEYQLELITDETSIAGRRIEKV